MGKASRRKKARRAARRPQAPRTGARVLRLAIPAVGAALLLAGLGLWSYQRGSAEPASAIAPLPDPDVSRMTAPVARAIRQARTAALTRRDSAEAVGRFGQVCHAHALYDAAAACYEIARQLSPGEFRWVYLLAGVEELRGAADDRIEELFRAAIFLAPGYAPAHVRYGDALLRLGRWAEARDAYAAAVQRDPDLTLAHRGLGQAALLLQDGATALEHLQQAAQLAPDDRITQVALARVYTILGQSEEADEAARKAETLSGEARIADQIFFEMERLAVNPASLSERAARNLREGNYDKAIEALTLLGESAGTAVNKQLAFARKQRANQLAFGGDSGAALAEFERAASLAPTDPEIEHNWGTVLLRSGKLAEARTHFEKAIQLDPRSADSLYNLGVVLEGLGRSEEAIEHFTAAAAINPRHVAAGRLAELGVTSKP